MSRELAPGLPGDWLNAWLAAIGITVLLPDVRLSWSDAAIPIAQFDHEGEMSLPGMVAESLLDGENFSGLVIESLKRNVTLDAFRETADKARCEHDRWLASSVSDLLTGKQFENTNLPHGPFDPPAPKGTTLHSRFESCRKAISDTNLEDRVAETLNGAAARIKNNGLGFDVRRLPSGMQPKAGLWVDPLVECLCFVALCLFPTRGNGREIRQRGWTARSTQRGAFRWPVWAPPLGVWGIDALLDQFHADPCLRRTGRLGVTGIFQSVPYQRRDASDPTRAYAAEKVG